MPDTLGGADTADAPAPAPDAGSGPADAYDSAELDYDAVADVPADPAYDAAELDYDSVDSDAPALDPERAAEQQVIAGAKAELVARHEAGDHLGGDPIGRADQWHWQGQNDRGFEGTCGLAASADVLRDAGVEVTEADLVEQAVDRGLCDVDDAHPADSGGTTAYDRDALLAANGVDSSVQLPGSTDELAAYVEDGHGVIARVSSDQLWYGGPDAPEVSPEERMETYSESFDTPSQPAFDHAVVVTGTVRDDQGTLTGFVINDHGDPEGAGRVVGAEQWDRCWTDVVGPHLTNVTDRPTVEERKLPHDS